MQSDQALADEEWNGHSPDYWSSLGPNMSRTNLTYAMELVSKSNVYTTAACSDLVWQCCLAATNFSRWLVYYH